MTKRLVERIRHEIAAVQGGDATPGRVWEIKSDGKGGVLRKQLNLAKYRQAQKEAWDRGIVAAREKLGLSQVEFAKMLGISVRTLHHWEQGTRQPSGAARVLLRVAAAHPEIVLHAVA